MTSKCTTVVAHFKGLADALVPCSVHCPVQYIQGYPGSHWTPPLGNYSLYIAPAATRASPRTVATYTAAPHHGGQNDKLKYLLLLYHQATLSPATRRGRVGL
jgi:hypothetical protein